MKPKDDDPPAVRQMKQIVVDDLNTRYTDPQIRDFLEEVTALDTRFKVSFLDENTQLQVYSRLTIAAADNWNETTVVVKREPDASMDNQHHTEDPALPTLPPEVKPDSISITSKENKSNPSDCSGNGLASVLGDVILVKVKKGNKSALERAEEEVKCYKLDDNTLFFSDPLLWWKNNEYKYPLLSSIAKKRLCIQATSVPSDCVFSTAGDIVTAQRASLTSEHVDMLLFLKKI